MLKKILYFSLISASIFAFSSVSARQVSLDRSVFDRLPRDRHARVCNAPSQNDFSVGCNARVVTDAGGVAKAAVLPAGYGPAQLRGAYNLTSATSTQTIAIVDAYDDPNVKADLDKYNQTFGLPFFPNCSSSITTSCFQKVDQRGGTRFPLRDAGWALEISLDVQVAHALCPGCKLLLVESDSNSYSNLLKAVDRAVALKANVVSMSWGSSEFPAETSNSYDGHFKAPGVVFTASSGDSGFGTSYPAASQYVTAVGGTTLAVTNNVYAGETVWSGAGSGCSLYEPQPSFQAALGLVGCTKRMIADVSADADPNTGAAVYDSVRYQGQSGWFKVGGTSLASPIIAATFALASNAGSISPANGYPYAHLLDLNDVISGSNGVCSVSFLCHGAVGYDGPSGVGSPNGIGSF